MKIDLKFAELHTALFMSSSGGQGVNMGLKLNTIGGLGHKDGVSLTYDRVEKELHVRYKGELAIIPSTNVASMTPKDPNVLGDTPTSAPATPAVKAVEPVKEAKTAPTTATKKVTAQVSSPQGHVFEGPGAGKNGQEK
jgi:hypothetical protein